jgi:DNA-binding protein HU-beta
MTTISKKELASRVAKNTKISQVQVVQLIDELLEQTKKALVKGEEIRLQGYFSLKTATTKARLARNLQTGKQMKVAAKRVPKCKFSLGLKEAITQKK